MSGMELRALTRVMHFKPGLYCVLYGGAEDARNPPKILLTCEPGSQDAVTFLPAPELQPGVLSAIGDVTAVRVDRVASVLLTVVASPLTGSDKVSVQVDRLGLAESGVAAAPGRRIAAPRVQHKVHKLRMVGHVERQGDLAIDTPAWLGKSKSKARIEGFSVLWPGRPYGIDLSYGVSVLGRGRQPDSLTGGFVGTRGEAAPIDAVTFDLVGDRASSFELSVEAAFSDGSVVGPLAAPADLSGPTGREYLVGLKVELKERVEQDRQDETRPAKPVAVAEPPRDDPGGRRRLRVFRAGREAEAI